MVFNTFAFAMFMTVVFLVYWSIPHKFRWLVLLAANISFYLSFGAAYLLILMFTIIISYLAGLGMDKQNKVWKRKLLLAVGAGTPLFLLLFFKYADTNWLMPVGISFYTFQVIGYLIDIYRGTISAEHHLGRYAVFVSFFPNIASGPIERAGNFIGQLSVEKQFQYRKAVYGSRLLLWGLVKKIVVADQLAKYVNVVFDHVGEHRGIVFALATVLYTFQIYFDFSGYSDMAMGLAKLLGFDLSVNFKSPYFASSIKDFWSRWHISLSTWFRDYVYISLGGNRVSKLRRSGNLILTFLISGMWHGADWTFVLWGGIHGVVQVIEKMLKEVWEAHRQGTQESSGKVGLLKRGGSTLLTFCIVSYAWMFFRANSIFDAGYMMRNMFTELSLSGAFLQIGMDGKGMIKVGGAIIMILLFDYWNQKCDLLSELNRIPALLRWILYWGTALAVVVLSMHGGVSQQFIYFNF